MSKKYDSKKHLYIFLKIHVKDTYYKQDDYSRYRSILRHNFWQILKRFYSPFYEISYPLALFDSFDNKTFKMIS